MKKNTDDIDNYMVISKSVLMCIDNILISNDKCECNDKRALEEIRETMNKINDIL